MPGPAPKPATRRQRHAERPTVALVPAAAPPPDCPRGLLKATRESWAAFWRSGVASAVDDADLPTVERLFRLRDMFTRAERAYRREPLMDGRKGGTIVNPVWKVLRDTAAELRQLEARFGITPQARFQLGITFSEARKRSLEDRIRDLQEDEEEQDPRLKPVK